MAPNRVAPVWASPSWADRAEPMMFSFGASNFYRLPRAMYQPLWPYQCQYQLQFFQGVGLSYQLLNKPCIVVCP